MKISIPTPCHEDWNKMTPKEQGSFCGSCAKIVVDFTKMKKEEIKQYFTEKKEEKTCGRFTVSQLSQNSSPQINKSFSAKFAFALYVVFGMTLFSCAQNSNHHVVGEIEQVIKVDSVNLIQDSVKIDTNSHVSLPTNSCPTNKPTFVKGDVVAESPLMMGKVKVNHVKADTNEVKDSVINNIDKLITPLRPEPIIMGAAVPVEDDFLLGEPAIEIKKVEPLKDKVRKRISEDE